MKRLFKYLKQRFIVKLPKEGSYIEYQSMNYIWKGIVAHHDDGKHYYIKTKQNTLCSIKP